MIQAGRTAFLVISSFCGMYGAQHGQAAAPVSPTADQVLAKYMAAVGGEAAIKKITTRVMKGTLLAPGGSPPLEIYQKAPDKFLIIIDSPVSGLSKNGFDGLVSWSQNRQGLREKSGPDVAFVKREQAIHREACLRELYPRLSVRGLHELGGRAVYVVETEPSPDVREAMYFDKETGLLIRWGVTIGNTTVQAEFDDYRQVDGVKLPFEIRRVRGDFRWTQRFSDISHNLPIADSQFAKPAQQ